MTSKCFMFSVQFSCSVVSDSLRPHEPQQVRHPCPSPTPRVHQRPSSWWCHATISSSVVPFSSCPQSFSASGSFPMSQLFASGGQSIGVSASISVPAMDTQDSSPLGWIGWISLQSKGLSSLLQQFSSVQSFSHVRLFATPWIAARQASLSITNSGVYSNSSSHLIFCCPLFLLPPIPPRIRVFSSGSTLRMR